MRDKVFYNIVLIGAFTLLILNLDNWNKIFAFIPLLFTYVGKED